MPITLERRLSTGNGRRPRRLCGLLLVILALAAIPAVPAAADHAPPPGEFVTGTGNLEGTELVEEQVFTGSLCFKASRSVFGLRGAGSYQGRTASGQEVVYRAQIGPNETLYGDGPLQVEVENTEPYYHGPFGTHGTADYSCAPATAGTPVPAAFRVFAPGNVYKLDDTGAQVPCQGQGTFARGENNGTGNTAKWVAEWTLTEGCVVVGNEAGTPGTGVSRAGTAFTHHGSHDPCFDPPCQNNFKIDYKQYPPIEGLSVRLSGPSSATVGKPVTVTARLTDDGVPVPNATVTFSVAGPVAAAPPGGAAVTGADGRGAFAFTAAAAGSYTVTALATNGADTASGTFAVQFNPAAPPTVTVAGPARAQTEEGVTVVATFTDAGDPVPGAEVAFAVAGAGGATPASGSAVTDAYGKAAFTFAGDRAGDYTVTASVSHLGREASGTHTVGLDINTFRRVGSTPLAAEEANPTLSAMDPTGAYAYFAAGPNPSGANKVVKVDLSSFQRVAAAPLPTNATIFSLVMDPTGAYAYAGTDQGLVHKLDLNTFEWVDSADLQIPQTNNQVSSAAIDSAGRYAYFGVRGFLNVYAYDPNDNYVARLVKVDLTTFEVVGSLNLETREEYLGSLLMDPGGAYVYITSRGEGGDSARVIKVDLRTFQRAGTLIFQGSDENHITSAVIDPGGDFAYFGLRTSPGRIVKVNLETFERVGTITLVEDISYLGPYQDDRSERNLQSAVIDPAGRYAYFGTDGHEGSKADPRNPPVPARLIRINLATFQRERAIELPVDTENHPQTAVIDPAGDFAYFGATKADAPHGPTIEQPGLVVKVAVSRPPNPLLAARDDGPAGYDTPYATALAKAAPGVLANDEDTGDGDPLTAGQASDPAHGSVTLNPDGSFVYTPDPGFSGADSFTYTATDRMDYSPPATVSVTVAAPPDGVATVTGGAVGFSTNVGLFGGPSEPRGPHPSVTLPSSGGVATDADGDGAVGFYGPAAIFGGIWPDDVAAAPPSGPLSVATAGTTGPGGSVTSSASIVLHDTPTPVRCFADPAGTTNCTAPGGIGPGPLIADEAHSTCTANESGLSGSARFVNGILETKYENDAQVPLATEPVPVNPPPNYTRTGTLDHIGDSYRVVFNEQILGPDSITVNAAHMYLLGPGAVGDMIIGQSRCGVEAAAPNAAPVAADDTYTTTAGRALTVPASGLLGNDTDADGQPLSAGPLAPTPPPTSGGGNWAFPSDPANGALQLGHDGSFTYTPKAGFTGTDTFTYLAQDARGKADAGTVTVIVEKALAAAADFDGNGTSDVAVYRPEGNGWYVQSGLTTGWGVAGDVPVPADYDGNGTTDVAVFRPSDQTWYVQGGLATQWGAPGDVPVPADYDGDGDTDIAVFRPSDQTWYVQDGKATQWGTNGDVPVPADYDGNGTTDVAVFRPSDQTWYVQDGLATQWGINGDVPAPADFDGDGDADIAVYRPGDQTWYAQSGLATQWGTSGDIAIPADYDGDGTADVAVFRKSDQTWYVQGGPSTQWGAPGDMPLAVPAHLRTLYGL